MSEFGFIGFMDYWIILSKKNPQIHKSNESKFRRYTLRFCQNSRLNCLLLSTTKVNYDWGSYEN